MDNHDDVVDQLISYGLRPNLPLEITGKPVRCLIDGSREKKGWLILHRVEMTGGFIIFGTFGIYRGDDSNLQVVSWDKKTSNLVSPEQRKVISKCNAEGKKKAEIIRKKQQNDVALKEQKAYESASDVGNSAYLDKHQIPAIDVRFDGDLILVPMRTVNGEHRGTQRINSKGEKRYSAGMSKKGLLHSIGITHGIVLATEGYGTSVTMRIATGLPTLTLFDAGNIMPAVKELLKRYPDIKLIICADDDAFSKCKHCKEPVNVNESSDCPSCNKPHGKRNTGIEAASLAAATSNNCFWMKPEFKDKEARFDIFKNQGQKLTDFNDQHTTDGLHTVRQTVDDFIDRCGLRDKLTGSMSGKQGVGDDSNIIYSVDEALDKIVLIKGAGGTIFHTEDHERMAKSDASDLFLRRDIGRSWQESPQRKIVRQDQVGFDPTGNDKTITHNTFDGWPTEPKKGGCELLLELLQYISSHEKEKSTELYEWVLKWLAYPIQHPGAKLSTTIVVHGGQGTGKNLFFEAIMQIYGKYGRIIDQPAIEDKFNDWASGKLFMIADEVVARNELHHIKNRLKTYITGQYIRINPKNMGAYQERNHINFVFLSNEIMPTVIDPDDRRHAVFWTPEKLSNEFYNDVANELKNGGVAALHDYLVNLPLGDFTPHTKPPMTKAKQDLIQLSKPSPIQFYDDWINGAIEGFDKPLYPIRTQHLFDLYRAWCPNNGCRAIDKKKLIGIISKQPRVTKHSQNYMCATKRANHVFITVPGALEVPVGTSTDVFYGQCVEHFNNKLDLYKDQ